MDMIKEIRAPLEFNQHKVDRQSHIAIKDAGLCKKKCTLKPCTYICPSQVYTWQNHSLRIDYARCVECGACHAFCQENILLNYPRGGFGVEWRY
ncbi:MAG: 4Fe-4S dicluster domain-containing protein [Clostridia bacterium]|nr:4Fe-4S dicluster domain-containing protein [Clostridia bacterium]